MAYIRVDRNQLKSTARKIDEFINFLKSSMRKADSAVNTMGSSWQGTDYATYKHKWDTVNNAGSSYGKMVSSLKSYSDYLDYANRRYSTAQSRAVNLANRLPRW